MRRYFSKGSCFVAVCVGMVVLTAHFLPGLDFLPLIVLLSLIVGILQVTHMLRVLLAKELGAFSWLWIVLMAPGTISHELCHWLMCKLLLVEVRKTVLFSPNPRSGQLGYVEFRLPRDSWTAPLRAFAIGWAPLIFGSCLLALTVFALNPEYDWLGSLDLIRVVRGDLPFQRAFEQGVEEWQKTVRPEFFQRASTYLWLTLAFLIGMGVGPSSADLALPFKQARKRWIPGFLSFLASLAISIFLVLQPVLCAGLIVVLTMALISQFLIFLVLLSLRLLTRVF